ncbi:hypothetical protein ACN28S_52730 [Cystobacter fuscus]
MRTKGYHGLGALAVEPTEMGAPVVRAPRQLRAGRARRPVRGV